MNSELGCRVGWAGGTSKSTIDDVRADARWAAETGFDSYWLSFVAGVDPLVALAVVASDVPELAELGTSVVPFAGRHPIALAQLARTTQQACGGRFTLGVGPSHQIVVESSYGEPWARPFQRTEEYLTVLSALCRGEHAMFEGEQVSANAGLDIPCDPVPVVLAALGPKMLELAGRTTAGTHLGNCGPRTIAEHIVPTFSAAADEADNRDARIITLVSVCVTDDAPAARAAAAQGLAIYGMLPSYRAMLDHEGVDGPEDLLVAGSIDDVVAGLKRYVEAGTTDLRLGIAAPDDATSVATRAAIAELVG